MGAASGRCPDEVDHADAAQGAADCINMSRGFRAGLDGLAGRKTCSDPLALLPETAGQLSQGPGRANAIFVQDGHVWSSAGVSAGIDLALAMIEEDFGHTIALDIARRLVVFLKRPGGQSQFSTVLAAQASDVEGRFSALHAWIIENIASELKVETLAERAGMTPRTFARTYVSRTGMTPANGVEALRVETARLLLESRQIGGVVEVAKRAGFGDDERMRRAFLRHLGVTPSEYRRRFSG